MVKKSAAYEVPLESRDDRQRFLLILQEQADEFGFHVDHATDEELAHLSEVAPQAFSASVWKGANDDESIASAMDLPSNLGRVWLSFPVGKDPDLSERFKVSLMQRVRATWPETKELPLLNGETIPLPDDLIVDGDRYILNPSVAHQYNISNAPSASPSPSS